MGRKVGKCVDFETRKEWRVRCLADGVGGGGGISWKLESGSMICEKMQSDRCA